MWDCKTETRKVIKAKVKSNKKEGSIIGCQDWTWGQISEVSQLHNNWPKSFGYRRPPQRRSQTYDHEASRQHQCSLLRAKLRDKSLHRHDDQCELLAPKHRHRGYPFPHDEARVQVNHPYWWNWQSQLWCCKTLWGREALASVERKLF